MESTFKSLKEKDKMLNGIAYALDETFKEIYGKRMGFFISVFEFNTEGISDYISNGKREDMIKALEETVRRFKNEETISTVIGEA